MKKLLIVSLLVSLLLPLTGQAQEEDIFISADDLYTVTIPTNWTIQEHDGYVTLLSPDEEILVHLLVVEGEDSEAAILAAWQQVDPSFALEPVNTQSHTDPAVTAGAEEVTVITYQDPADPNMIYQGLALRYQGKIYLQLYQGNLIAFQERQAQVTLINTSYKITAMEEINLAEVEPLPITDDLLAELEAYIITEMDKLEVTGASVAIVQGNEVLYSKGFGVRGGDSNEPVTPDTLMMIGSTTKTMTTMFMGIMVDEGAMQWDTPVVDILPSFAVADPEITQQMTVQHLVCACTGVPRRDFELIFNGNELSAENIIESLATFEFFTDFGEAFQYSNQMVATGGYIATLAGGGTYGNLNHDYVDQMENRIFAPIGMASTTFSFEEVRANDNYAVPYMVNIVGEYQAVGLETEEWLQSIAPAGAVWSTANDMARYLMTEINQGTAPNGTQVISAENLAYTWQPQVSISAEAQYGLGWIIEQRKGVQILSHGGNTLGYSSEMAFLPDHGIGIVVLTNQRGSAFNGAVSHRLLELLYQQEPEYEAQLDFMLAQSQEGVAEFNAQRVEIAPEVIEQLVGTFTNEALGEITLSVVDDQLILDEGTFQAVIVASEDEEGEIIYILFDSPLAGIPLKPSEDGQTLILGEGVVEYTFQRVE